MLTSAGRESGTLTRVRQNSASFMHQKYHEQTKNIQNIMLITLISLSICIYLLYCNCACTSEFMDTCCLWGSTGTDIRNAARFCKISSFFNCFIWSNNVNQNWGVLIKLGWCIEHAGTSAVKMMTNIAYIRDQHLNGLHPHQCLSLAEAASIVTTWGSLATLVSAFMWRGVKRMCSRENLTIKAATVCTEAYESLRLR